MSNLFIGLVYLMFFLSGAAGLIYEVVWFRSLSLIFGGSHLAATTVLSVFMAGLALGSYVIGKRVSRITNLLRLYGMLELAIALSAGIFVLLTKFYPVLYVPLARFYPESPLYLSFIRVVLSALALIVPTTLMGATLPVLSGLMSEQGKWTGIRLSFLYGINTLGAMAGTLGAGFFLMRHLTVNLTLLVPVLLNVVVGVLAVLLNNRTAADNAEEPRDGRGEDRRPHEYTDEEIRRYRLPLKLVLWGIGVSGFCALGYEVLWTKMLSIILGASTYSFTVMLAAFLSGIGLGSSAYGVMLKMARARSRKNGSLVKAVIGFGLVQCIIGLTAILATGYFFDLPALSFYLQQFLKSSLGAGIFSAWQWTNFVVAFFYMFIPAFFMGIAFPLAGDIHATYRKAVGLAIGEIMAFNTVGAILGAAVSGYALIYLFGIERALQMLSLVNIGYGAFLIAGTRQSRLLNGAVGALVLAAMLFLAFNPAAFRALDPRYLAIYKSNRPDLFLSREKVDRTLQNTKVLYYGEGAEAIVSSTLSRDRKITFTTNGWNEASTSFADMQCQYSLGHLPMLLNKDPKKVFVVGLGSGMTLGATSIYPGVEEIILAEIEPKVVGVAKTFAFYNHNVLSNPKLKIVFNDGRNFLLTTTETFDVITADPIHPFFRGAGYLYTAEYFKLASEHLRPGGIMCQWLPMYHLTRENFASVVKTFNQQFKYTMVWLTVYDVELVGSNSPIILDEKELQKRMEDPAIAFDLQWMMMRTVDDFLSYFVMGPEGTQAFARGATVNTDENLYLEFSAPFSYNREYQEAENMASLLMHRENIIPYLADTGDSALRQRQLKKWRTTEKVFPLVDEAHTLILRNRMSTPEFRDLMKTLDREYPFFAPWNSMKVEIGG